MRTRGIRGWLAVASLAAAIGAAPAEAAPPRAAGFILTRSAPGSGVLTGTMSATSRGSGATVLLVAMTGKGMRRTHDSAFTTARIDWGTDGWASVYGSGVATPPCQAATCDDPASTPFSFGFSSNGHRVASTVYVAGWDADVAVTVTSPGWRVRPWRPAMRVLRADQGGGTGARVLHTTAGTFSSVESPGGRYGSFAWGTLPCRMWGDGRGALTGGSQTYDLDCDGIWGWRGSNARATRWRLAGDVTGLDGIVNVLVVVDLPR